MKDQSASDPHVVSVGDVNVNVFDLWGKTKFQKLDIGEFAYFFGARFPKRDLHHVRVVNRKVFERGASARNRTASLKKIYLNLVFALFLWWGVVVLVSRQFSPTNLLEFTYLYLALPVSAVPFPIFVATISLGLPFLMFFRNWLLLVPVAIICSIRVSFDYFHDTVWKGVWTPNDDINDALLGLVRSLQEMPVFWIFAVAIMSLIWLSQLDDSLPTDRSENDIVIALKNGLEIVGKTSCDDEAAWRLRRHIVNFCGDKCFKEDVVDFPIARIGELGGILPPYESLNLIQVRLKQVISAKWLVNLLIGRNNPRTQTFAIEILSGSYGIPLEWRTGKVGTADSVIPAYKKLIAELNSVRAMPVDCYPPIQEDGTLGGNNAGFNRTWKEIDVSISS